MLICTLCARIALFEFNFRRGVRRDCGTALNKATAIMRFTDSDQLGVAAVLPAQLPRGPCFELEQELRPSHLFASAVPHLTLMTLSFATVYPGNFFA